MRIRGNNVTLGVAHKLYGHAVNASLLPFVVNGLPGRPASPVRLPSIPYVYFIYHNPCGSPDQPVMAYACSMCFLIRTSRYLRTKVAGHVGSRVAEPCRARLSTKYEVLSVGRRGTRKWLNLRAVAAGLCRRVFFLLRQERPWSVPGCQDPRPHLRKEVLCIES